MSEAERQRCQWALKTSQSWAQPIGPVGEGHLTGPLDRLGVVPVRQAQESLQDPNHLNGRGECVIDPAGATAQQLAVVVREVQAVPATWEVEEVSRSADAVLGEVLR